MEPTHQEDHATSRCPCLNRPSQHARWRFLSPVSRAIKSMPEAEPIAPKGSSCSCLSRRRPQCRKEGRQVTTPNFFWDSLIDGTIVDGTDEDVAYAVWRILSCERFVIQATLRTERRKKLEVHLPGRACRLADSPSVAAATPDRRNELSTRACTNELGCSCRSDGRQRSPIARPVSEDESSRKPHPDVGEPARVRHRAHAGEKRADQTTEQLKFEHMTWGCIVVLTVSR